MTVIGIPVAVWFLIRYQFMAQAIVTEDLDGKAGLRRSSSLVSGRWWHTAVMVALVNLLVALSGAAVGLVLLVLVAGIPMWLFSGLDHARVRVDRTVRRGRDDAPVRRRGRRVTRPEGRRNHPHPTMTCSCPA